MSFEAVSENPVFEGEIFSVIDGRYRHEDGEVVTRQWVTHPGAVAIVAHDGERLWLVRQPREAVGEPDLLEIPAGKCDEPGESTLDCAKRELAEEIGKAASDWEHLTTYWAAAGFTSEQMHIYLATGLSDRPGYIIEEERITVETVALTELDPLIAANRDAKSIIGLMLLRERLR